MAGNHLQTVAATPGPRLTILNKEVMANRVDMEAAVMNKKSEATDHSKRLHLDLLSCSVQTKLSPGLTASSFALATFPRMGKQHS